MANPCSVACDRANLTPSSRRTMGGVIRRAVRMARVSWPIAVLLSACFGAEGANRARATFRDSAGVRIAENPSPDDSANLVWWGLEGPQLDVGGEAVTDEYALFRVGAAARLGDDRFVVANGGSSDLRFYDLAGRHVATIGREGEGPGEFRNIGLLLPGPADSLTVYDGALRRFSVISPNPAFAREFRFSDVASVSRVIGRTAAGEYVGYPAGVRGSPDEFPNGLSRPDQVITLHDETGAVIDTIGTFAGPERVINVRQRNGEIVSIEIGTPPFARNSSFVLAGDALWVGTQDGPELRRYGLDGSLDLILRTGRQAVPVTDEHVNALIEQRLEDAPSDAHARIRAGYETMPRFEFVPPYGSVQADAAGRLWVADYANPLAPAGRYTVYGEDGGILARIILPERFRPLDIGGDWILGTELDELDVEHLRLYRIVESP